MVDSRKRNKPYVDPTLSSACAKNLSLDLRILDDTPPTTYRSRFLGLTERPREITLLIEAPTDRGSTIPVRPGQAVRITFTLADRDRYFETVVLDRGRHQLNPDVSIPALELQVPEKVVVEGKRSFYRVTFDYTHKLVAKLAILADDESGGTRVRGREKVVLTDLGGGGLGFRISEGKSLLLNPGTRVLLTFSLGSEEEIKLRGRICFSLRQPELREAFFGVQFIDIESDIAYKRSVDSILHFVAEEQRRNLGERSKSD